jgi:hypothetical protein
VCQIAGETESVLYSVIDDILVVPMVTPAAIVRGQPAVQSASLLKLEMVRYMLRLRTQKIAAVLEPLTKGASSDQLSDVAQHVLTQGLRHQLPPTGPLVRASENFTLAHNLIGKRNYPLAALALNGAANALDLYAKNAPIRDHSQIVQSMRRQIALMIVLRDEHGSLFTEVGGKRPIPALGRGANRGSGRRTGGSCDGPGRASRVRTSTDSVRCEALF